MAQARLKHQGRSRPALDLWLGPSHDTMEQKGTNWSEPERAARFSSCYTVLRLSQVRAAIRSIVSAVLPAAPIRTSLSGVKCGHKVLEAIRGSGPGGDKLRRSIRDLFVFIGANPNTVWLAISDVILDTKGLTGREVGKTHQPLATNVPGPLATSGVRSGLVKRAAAAVGEGAQAVRALLALLAVAAPSRAAVGHH